MARKEAPIGFVTFIADCLGPQLSSTRVAWKAKFPFVTVETTPSQTLAIQVACSPSHDAERTVLGARAVAERIVRELAYRQKCSIGALMQRDTEVVVIGSDGHMTRRKTSAVGFRFGGSATAQVVLSPSSVSMIVAAARDTQIPERDSDLELARSAFAVSDPIGRFILLYATLQYLIGAERQDELDDWIWSNDRGVPHVPKPPKLKNHANRLPNPDETPVTAVRSSLAHVRDQQTSFSAAVKEARRLKGDLERYIDLALSAKYP
jgi:hypothetical protein